MKFSNRQSNNHLNNFKYFTKIIAENKVKLNAHIPPGNPWLPIDSLSKVQYP